jgi:MYXO-CTERM domain-containing protein
VGQTVDVVAEFRASATARVGSVDFDCGDPAGPCLAFKGSASAIHGHDDFFGTAAAGLGEEALRILPTSAVPEPAGAALALAGLVLLTAWRRRA